MDKTEGLVLKGEKRVLAKLDQRVRDLELDSTEESRRHTETLKNYQNKERKVRELELQVDEAKNSNERMHYLAKNLQAKIKTYKKQWDELHILEDVEERVDIAENALAKIRAKNRIALQSNASITNSRFSSFV
ncbi:unnamed protein product [Thelazia callipaeda]|uniref:Myosin_tail_1 domain-containing protein n=1 Tax=Thelazia callipaeda TaxID=103827 RepID=A0A0N5DB30_THECL|nr:unnamed protein product [Thelazia callipaeda]